MSTRRDSGERLLALARGDSLSRQAYSEVRRAIRDGIVVPGEIYSEPQLAERLGVSRTPVREALIELAREGAVDILPQRGFRLRDVSEKERHEVFAIRSLLEAYVVGELAHIATPDHVRHLSAILDAQMTATDATAFLELDETFHLLLADFAGLERSRQLLFALRPVVWLSGVAALANEARMTRVVGEHQAILDRVAVHDAGGARRAARKHISETAASAARVHRSTSRRD